MTNKKSTIGIIGFGNFGTLLASVLSEHFDVLVYHYRNTSAYEDKAKKIGVKLVNLETASKCDTVILSVPISKTKEMIRKIAPLMKKGSLLMDTCSVKVYPCEWLQKYTNASINIIGTHPMFGPTTSNFDLEKQTWKLDNLQIVLCPLRIKKEKLKELKAFFKKLKLKVITTTPEEHDKQNAKTLSFVHFVGRSLLAAGIGHQKIFTPGYTDLLSILPHTTSDNWQLFYDMNNYNPYSGELREKFRDSGLEIEERIIRNRDEGEMLINRDMIDLIDTRIMKLLQKRFECATNIGKIKKAKNIKIIDAKREDKIIKEKTKQSNMNNDFIKKFYKLIFSESYKKQ